MRKILLDYHLLLLMLIVLVPLLQESNHLSQAEGQLKGDYLGQKPPGRRAAKFNEGALVGYKRSFNLSFSPDGKDLFFSYNKSTPALRNPAYEIRHFRQVDGVWVGPDVTFFFGEHKDRRASQKA